LKKKIFIGTVLFSLAFALLISAQTVKKSTIFAAKCVGCGDCVRGCPVKAITMIKGKAVIDTEKCVGCRLCVVVCSYGAPK